ncbi:hypothetical protein BGZ46_000556, partial [Entomortierella lignicola]
MPDSRPASAAQDARRGRGLASRPEKLFLDHSKLPADGAKSYWGSLKLTLHPC